jgi:hypothetical protein
MISRLAVVVGCLSFAGAALADSNAAESAAAATPAKLETIELPPGVGKLVLSDTRVVEIDSLDTGLECQRRVPTGSRIATQNCYTREEAQSRAIAQQAARRSVEELRDLQMYQEMARAEARRRAIAEMTAR